MTKYDFESLESDLGQLLKNVKKHNIYARQLENDVLYLEQKVNQLETNRDEAIEYIEQVKYRRDDQIFVDILHPYLDKLLEILERGKE